MNTDSPYKPPETDIEISDGYNFTFNIDDVVIKAGGSSFSGKETIYLNNELISEARSHKIKSLHEFIHNGATYRIEFKVLSMLEGTLACSLFKNGRLTSQYIATPRMLNDPALAITVIAAFIIFLAVSDYMGLPGWTFAVAIAAAVPIVIRHSLKHIEISEVEIQQ